MWGAWIEIANSTLPVGIIMSHPVWGAWIEIAVTNCLNLCDRSHPVWGAWIEISAPSLGAYANTVAPRVGCVD